MRPFANYDIVVKAAIQKITKKRDVKFELVILLPIDLCLQINGNA